MLNPTVQCFPSNNVNERNVMIANNSGSFQAKEKNFKLSTVHIATQMIKIINHRDESGVENLKHKDWL
jgi:hypothetical protein